MWRPQTWVHFQNKSFFYCTLYTDFPGGGTDAVARHVSCAQITCCITNALVVFAACAWRWTPIVNDRPM